MWHKPCRTFHPWCPCINTRCLCVWIIPNIYRQLLIHSCILWCHYTGWQTYKIMDSDNLPLRFDVYFLTGRFSMIKVDTGSTFMSFMVTYCIIGTCQFAILSGSLGYLSDLRMASKPIGEKLTSFKAYGIQLKMTRSTRYTRFVTRFNGFEDTCRDLYGFYVY